MLLLNRIGGKEFERMWNKARKFREDIRWKGGSMKGGKGREA